MLGDRCVHRLRQPFGRAPVQVGLVLPVRRVRVVRRVRAHAVRRSGRAAVRDAGADRRLALGRPDLRRLQHRRRGDGPAAGAPLPARERDAVVAGVLAGPLAMLPGLLFFVCMIAWYPSIGAEALPSDFMLRQLDMPVFHLLFQAMIFSRAARKRRGLRARGERTHRGHVAHAARRRAVERRRASRSPPCCWSARSSSPTRFGLVELIARGYRALAWLFLVVYVAAAC